MMSAHILESARLSKLWILYLNDLLDGYLCKKNFFYFHIFFFSGFQTWCYQMRNFTRIAASNLASDDVTD